MAVSQPYFTATVVYEYVWKVSEASKETSTYTTHYVNSPGSHTRYAIIINTALPSASQLETIGIPYSISPGKLSMQHVLATVATSMPTSSVQHSTQTPWPTATGISNHAPHMSKESCHAASSKHSLTSLHGTTPDYLQMALLFLVLCGYLVLRLNKAQRSQSDGLEEGRGRGKDVGQAFADEKGSPVDAKS